MSKKLLNFTVDEALRDAFDEAIEGKFDSRSHAFRTFMREVVESYHNRSTEK
jgi:metal-responsive CopG/Arc/MetJ family transcriptional regulator